MTQTYSNGWCAECKNFRHHPFGHKKPDEWWIGDGRCVILGKELNDPHEIQAKYMKCGNYELRDSLRKKYEGMGVLKPKERKKLRKKVTKR